MTTLYLIRHAEAEGNLFRRMHGQLDSMITPTGMKQIAALAGRFADIPVDLCYASDLLRTRTTAQALTLPKGLPLYLDPAFRELQVGVWEDRTFGDLQAHEPSLIEGFSKDPAGWQVEGSERMTAYAERFIKAMTNLAEAHPDKTIAIFSHAAVMRGVLLTLFPGIQVLPSDNTCVTKLLWQEGRYILEYQNDNGHLSPEISTAARNRAMGEGFERTDNLFWFRSEPGASEKETAYTVMAGAAVAGSLQILEIDDDTSALAHMELLPHWQGRGRSVQILGQAVLTLRAKGKKTLVFQKPENGSLDSLCRLMDLEADQQGMVRMNLRPWLRPFRA